MLTTHDALTRRTSMFVACIVVSSTTGGIFQTAIFEGAFYPWWYHTIASVCIMLSAFFIYLDLLQITNDRLLRFDDVRQNRTVTLLLIAISSSAILDWARRQSLVSFYDYRTYDRSFTYIISFTLFALVLFIVESRVIVVFYASLRYSNEGVYKVRAWLIIVGFCIAALSGILNAANLLLAIVASNPLVVQLSWFAYTFLGPSAVAIIVIAVMVPKRVFLWIGHPISNLTSKRRQNQERRLRFLYQQLHTIVPMSIHVDSSDPQLQLRRLLVEIADAWEAIWSVKPFYPSMSPRFAARHIADLIAQKHRMTRLGPYHVIPIPQERAAGYFSAVALHLQQLIPTTVETERHQ